MRRCGIEGVRVRASCYLTPSGDFAVRFILQGSSSAVAALLVRGFPYTLLIEGKKGGPLALRLVEESEGLVIWSTSNRKDAREALGRIVERGGFEEECSIVSESLLRTRREFRRVPEADRRAFRNVLETSLEVCI